MDAAVNHYIEAGCTTKAIESAIAARQWTKVVQIVEAQSTEVTFLGHCGNIPCTHLKTSSVATPAVI